MLLECFWIKVVVKKGRQDFYFEQKRRRGEERVEEFVFLDMFLIYFTGLENKRSFLFCFVLSDFCFCAEGSLFGIVRFLEFGYGYGVFRGLVVFVWDFFVLFFIYINLFRREEEIQVLRVVDGFVWIWRFVCVCGFRLFLGEFQDF